MRRVTPAKRLNFKSGGWQAILSSVGSTPTRFRHFVFNELAGAEDFVGRMSQGRAGAREDSFHSVLLETSPI